MRMSRMLLSVIWVAASVVAICAWLIAAFISVFNFVAGYGSPLGSYTGQADDRYAGWWFFRVVLLLSAAICVMEFCP
jgi:hypothetical protein